MKTRLMYANSDAHCAEQFLLKHQIRVCICRPYLCTAQRSVLHVQSDSRVYEKWIQSVQE